MAGRENIILQLEEEFLDLQQKLRKTVSSHRLDEVFPYSSQNIEREPTEFYFHFIYGWVLKCGSERYVFNMASSSNLTYVLQGFGKASGDNEYQEISERGTDDESLSYIQLPESRQRVLQTMIELTKEHLLNS